MGGDAVTLMAGATTLGNLAGAMGIRAQESAIVAELKAGSEDAYAWLIGEFHQPIYSLVYRIVTDPADAADTTQEVFLKVFRGMKHFHGESSLKTWIYRIAVHEASNRRRWWFRHKAKETSIRSRETNLRQNGWWLQLLVGSRRDGDDPASRLDLNAQLAQLTPETIRAAARTYLDRTRYVRVTLLPEAKTP